MPHRTVLFRSDRSQGHARGALAGDDRRGQEEHELVRGLADLLLLEEPAKDGISPKTGTLRMLLIVWLLVIPPTTRRSPALIRTWVSALRLLMAGTAMPPPMLTVSPRELFSTSTTILILLTTVSPTCSRSTLGTTSSLSTASLNWICVPAELTVA